MSKGGVQLKLVDNGYRKLCKEVFGFDRPKITVGIHAAEGGELEPGGVTVLQVAQWNEFGTEKIPERSFIRAWFDANEGRAREMLRALMKSVIDGKRTKAQILELLGQKFQAEIQARMAEGIPPPNAESTIDRKGSDKPLIDNGQLRSSITYKVQPK